MLLNAPCTYMLQCYYIVLLWLLYVLECARHARTNWRWPPVHALRAVRVAGRHALSSSIARVLQSVDSNCAPCSCELPNKQLKKEHIFFNPLALFAVYQDAIGFTLHPRVYITCRFCYLSIVIITQVNYWSRNFCFERDDIIFLFRDSKAL